MMRALSSVALLFASNVFMTTAWYLHLTKKGQWPIILAIITLVVFLGFTMTVLKERPRTNDMVAFGLILLAVVVSVSGGRGSPTP